MQTCGGERGGYKGRKPAFAAERKPNDSATFHLWPSVHIAGVSGSSPLSPTKLFKDLAEKHTVTLWSGQTWNATN
jgi:hypothetical protein